MNAGSFKKGEKRPGQGKRGPGKVTADLKLQILGALDDVGGQEYLVMCAKTQPKAFLALLGRVLPMQVAGDPNAPLAITWPVPPSRVER